MKGLVIKDFCLIFQRKRSLMIFIAVGLIMSFSVDPAFFLGWMVLIGTLFAVGTIAYDEYDNGYPFLMTLPASRKCYAVEKYVFGAICAAVFWLAGVILCVISALVRGEGIDLAAEGISFFIILLVPFLIIDFCVPLDLKYGSEKGRIYMVIAWGVIFAAVFIANQYVGSGTLETAVDAAPVSDTAQGLAAAAIIFVFTALATLVSVACSVRIMAKKEF